MGFPLDYETFRVDAVGGGKLGFFKFQAREGACYLELLLFFPNEDLRPLKAVESVDLLEPFPRLGKGGVKLLGKLC